MAAAATLSAHPAPCSGQPRSASLQKPELGFLPHSGQQLPGPLSAPDSPLRSPGSGLVVCVRASVCVSECRSARACGRGSPRSPPERGAGGGWQLPLGPSLRGQLASRRSAPHFPTGVRRALSHPDSQHWQSRASGACFCCGGLGGRAGGRQGRPHANLGTCSQSTRRSSPRDSQRGLELQRVKASLARSRPPRRRAEADPAVLRRRRGARPPVPGAHGGDRARIGGCLAKGVPAAVCRYPWC